MYPKHCLYFYFKILFKKPDSQSYFKLRCITAVLGHGSKSIMVAVIGQSHHRILSHGRRSLFLTGVGGGGGGGLENERWGREGSRAILPQKSLKSRGSKMVFSTFSMRYFMSKSF